MSNAGNTAPSTGEVVWRPSSALVKQANITRFMRAHGFGKSDPTADYPAFVKKSIFGPAQIHAAEVVVGISAQEDSHDAGSTIEVSDLRSMPIAVLESLRAEKEFSRDRFRALTDRKP